MKIVWRLYGIYVELKNNNRRRLATIVVFVVNKLKHAFTP